MAGTVCLVLPYLLLAAPAGYLADRYPKRSVIVGCKLAEIVIMVDRRRRDSVRHIGRRRGAAGCS